VSAVSVSQVSVSRCYGRLYQDSQYKDLFHIPCCDPGQAFVFDFEHTGSGIHNDRFKEVTLQTAFQYSTVVQASSTAGSSTAAAGSSSSGVGVQQQQQGGAGRGGSVGPRYVVQRRLRVCTVRWVPLLQHSLHHCCPVDIQLHQHNHRTGATPIGYSASSAAHTIALVGVLQSGAVCSSSSCLCKAL
jgi:hypothetical protein